MPKITAKRQIGQFIQKLREQKGWSEIEMATKLEIEPEMLVKMEMGRHNFSTEMLEKISQVLEHKIVKIDPSIDFEIEGGHELSGEIAVNCSKNGAMGLLCASLLNKSKTILHGIPRIEEVFRIIEVMESIDVVVNWTSCDTLEIIPPETLQMDQIDRKTAAGTRTIIMFMGPLIHLFPEFRLPHSQGCQLGKRTISAHLYGLEKMGVKIKVTKDSYDVKVAHFPLFKDNFTSSSREIVMYESGDTATENLIIAASKMPGKTVIKFASSNYMVQDVCFFLIKCGVRIEGIGTSTLTIFGISEINQEIEFWNSEDPIEAMTFLSAGICTNSQITIKRCPIDFLELELLKLDKMGFRSKMSKKYLSKNGLTKLVDITTLKNPDGIKLKAPTDKLYGGPFPALNIDNLPFFVPIVCLSKGTTLIHDWVFEDRVISFMELKRMGANMILADPHRVFVTGISSFKPAQIVCPPILRSAMMILIAMLTADGKSTLRNVYSIKRGYAQIAERLNSLGAKITVV
jgi:UDP-N-acetylglucosamine 1-carboxyvinyltransferase